MGGLFFSHFATTFKRSLRVMRILSVLEVLAFVAFGLFTAFLPLLILTVIVSFFNSAYFTIQDGTCTIAMKKAGKGYESVRIFGSIAYAVALIGGFFIVGVIPYRVLYLIAAFFFLAGFVLTFLIVPAEAEIPERTAAPGAALSSEPEEKKGLFANRQFVYFLLFNTLFFASVNTLGTLLSVYLKKIGLQDNEYSLWYGLRVVAEIASLLIFPFVFKKLKSHKKSLMISGTLFILSGILAVVVPEKEALVSSTFLIRGFANGFSLVSGVLLLHNLVGDRLVTRALVFCGALCNFFTGLGNLFFDTLSRNSGYSQVFLILSLISLAGFAFLFLVKEPQEQWSEKTAPSKI
jgi:PPP family 3-phenylpropionic acid transporter